MSVTAAAGILSFGPQAGMGQVPASWFRHRATAIDLSVLDEVREGGMEVGGIAVPTFPYKSGYMVGGGFALQPRLADTIGWLLYGMMGDVTTTESPGASGLYNHVFKMAPSSTTVPWMGFRKSIPRRGDIAASDLGEEFKDCKIIGGAFTMPASEPINMRVDVLGRDYEHSLTPDAWVYDNEFEHWESIPVGCATAGYIMVDGAELPVVSAQIGWQNAPLDPRQERVFGSPMLDDVTIIQRRLTIDLMVKWNSPDLYLKATNGGATNVSWTSAPFTGSLSVKTVSSVNIPLKTEPYSLIIDADEIMLQPVGGVQLAAGQGIMMRFQGSALEATNYASFTLRNQKASYSWPVGSGS